MFDQLISFGSYSESEALSKIKRGSWWENKYSSEISTSVGQAITDLGLDEPWEKIHEDPMKEAVANALFGSILSCFGPKMTLEMHLALNRQFLGKDFDDMHTTGYDTTANHESAHVTVFPLDSDGKPLSGLRASYNMPTFPTRSDGIPTIGDISPISLSEKNGVFQLHFSTPSGHIWNKQLIVRTAPDSSNEVVGQLAGKDVYVRDIAPPCASNKHRVLFLRATCAQNCLQCGVTRGDGFFTKERQAQVSETLDFLLKDEKGDTFWLTLSGGSENSPDGGFKTAHRWALEEIEKKLKLVKENTGRDMKANLELEMMLPPDKETWEETIKTLNQYKDLGWNLSLAMNMEALSPKWRTGFIRAIKGKSNLEDYIEFARKLKEKTGGRIRMSTLVMSGMKPVELSYREYMLEELEIIEKLLAAGIGVDLNPVKLQIGRVIESFPPPDPVFYMVQDFALRQMNSKTHLPTSYGCVASCGLCHHKEATLTALQIAEKIAEEQNQNNPLPTVLERILNKLGTEYRQKFSEIFQKATQ